MSARKNIALVTGGAAGIGFALAEQLLKRNWAVLVCDRGEDALAQARSKLPTLDIVICDVTVGHDREALRDRIVRDHGSLDLLVNNAGIQHAFDLTGDVDPAEVLAEISVNLVAPVLLAQALMPLLRASGGGTIANVTSALAFCPKAAMPIYCATKAALHAYTLCQRHQLAEVGVRVVELVPPVVESGLGGVSRTGRIGQQQIMSATAFAADAIAQMEDGRDQVLVGQAVRAKAEGERLFEFLNG